MEALTLDDDQPAPVGRHPPLHPTRKPPCHALPRRKLTSTHASTATQEWGHLPGDVLQAVFRQLFASAPPPAAGPAAPAAAAAAAAGPLRWPLSAAWAQLTTLRLTCKAWARVLDASPPPLRLGLSGAPGAALLDSWLHKQRVEALHLCPDEDAAWARPSNNNPADPAPAGDPWARAARGRAAHFRSPAMVASRALARGLPGLPALRHLTLRLADDDSAPPRACPLRWLRGLPALRSLALAGFCDFDLAFLPPGVRRLALGYSERVEGRELPALSVPWLPPGAALEELLVGKPAGVVGLRLAHLLRHCRECPGSFLPLLLLPLLCSSSAISPHFGGCLKERVCALFGAWLGVAQSGARWLGAGEWARGPAAC